MRKLFEHPLSPLAIYSVVVSYLMVPYLLHGVGPSPLFQLVNSMGLWMLVALWVTHDSRKERNVPCFEFGFLAALIPTVGVPWYCFWSRGWRGVFLLGFLAYLWVCPYIASVLVWNLLQMQVTPGLE